MKRGGKAVYEFPLTQKMNRNEKAFLKKNKTLWNFSVKNYQFKI